MERIHDFLIRLDTYIGGHPWFIVLLLGTGIFFTVYLKFPQFRYFKHAVRIVRGKFDKEDDEHFPHAEIAKHVVHIKTCIERIREMVQNVE